MRKYALVSTVLNKYLKVRVARGLSGIVGHFVLNLSLFAHVRGIAYTVGLFLTCQEITLQLGLSIFCIRAYPEAWL